MMQLPMKARNCFWCRVQIERLFNGIFSHIKVLIHDKHPVCCEA